MSCITITFGDQAENHAGMQKIGKMADEGFSIKDLKKACSKLKEDGYECELIHLNKYLPSQLTSEDAMVLVVREGVTNFLVDPDELLEEMSDLEWDTKAKMRGRVVNKRARYNLCFDKKGQSPDYENGKGRIVSFEDTPLLREVVEMLPDTLGEKASSLKAEGNLYYDLEKCGIGFHGDAERKKVVALRLGESMPLYYQWWYKSLPISKRVELEIRHGDFYVMSEKATGNDWMKKNTPTLRHSVGKEGGFAIYTTPKNITKKEWEAYLTKLQNAKDTYSVWEKFKR